VSDSWSLWITFTSAAADDEPDRSGQQDAAEEEFDREGEQLHPSDRAEPSVASVVRSAGFAGS
jgi:hypothetical protein